MNTYVCPNCQGTISLSPADTDPAAGVCPYCGVTMPGQLTGSQSGDADARLRQQEFFLPDSAATIDALESTAHSAAADSPAGTADQPLGTPELDSSEFDTVEFKQIAADAANAASHAPNDRVATNDGESREDVTNETIEFELDDDSNIDGDAEIDMDDIPDNLSDVSDDLFDVEKTEADTLDFEMPLSTNPPADSHDESNEVPAGPDLRIHDPLAADDPSGSFSTTTDFESPLTLGPLEEPEQADPSVDSSGTIGQWPLPDEIVAEDPTVLSGDSSWGADIDDSQSFSTDPPDRLDAAAGTIPWQPDGSGPNHSADDDLADVDLEQIEFDGPEFVDPDTSDVALEFDESNGGNPEEHNPENIELDGPDTDGWQVNDEGTEQAAEGTQGELRQDAPYGGLESDTYEDIVSPTLDTSDPLPRINIEADDDAGLAADAVDFTPPVDDDDTLKLAPPQVITSPEAAVAGTVAGASLAQYRPKKKKSFLRPLISCLLAGVMAIPLAQIVLWWLPGSWSRDPLGLGPAVGKYAPWAIPEKFHPAETAVAVGPASLGTGDPSAVVDAPVPPDGGGQEFPGETSRPGDLPEESAEITVARVDSDFDPLARRTSENGRPGAGRRTALDTSEPDTDLADLDPLNDPSLQPAEADSTASIRILDAQASTASELRAALQRAEQLHADFSQASGAEKKELAPDWQATLNEVGLKVAYLDATDEDSAATIATLRNWCEQLSANQKMLDLLARSAKSWLSNARRGHAGVLLVGTVKDVVSETGYQELQLIHRFKKGRELRTIVLQTPSQLGMPRLDIDDKAIILGAIVNDPAIRISRYSGEAESLVWAGLVVPVESR